MRKYFSLNERFTKFVFELKTGQEYKDRFAEALRVFTNKGQPGQKMKSVKDQITKCLAFPAAVRKAYGISPTMDETSVPIDPDKDDKSNVEEKLGKYFGYLARCEGKFGTTTLKNKNFGSKWDENTEFDSAKI